MPRRSPRSGLPSDASRLLAPLAQLLEGLAAGLAPDAEAASAPLLDALAEALDAEIARWEARARDDAEARAVLRAFLGVRELLWELGLRRRERRTGAAAGRHAGGPGPAKGRVRRARCGVARASSASRSRADRPRRLS